MPPTLTCVYLKEPMVTTAEYGLFNVTWTTRLQRGPYWSEKQDDGGIYYRAPPGGISITGSGGGGLPGQPTTTDGGFYVPDDKSKPITIYRYFTSRRVPELAPPENMTCANLGYMQDPKTYRYDIVTIGAAGAVSGAAGGLIGRSIAQNSGLSYGKSAVAGAAGGLIGGLIVGAIINSSVGKIVPGMELKDQKFMDQLRKLVSERVTINFVASPKSDH